jgi:hypothetical protein
MAMIEVEVMDKSGHTRHIWDSDKPEEVEAARTLYNSLTGRGYRAFRVAKNGEEGERMSSFDPDAEKMILVPALQGG